MLSELCIALLDRTEGSILPLALLNSSTVRPSAMAMFSSKSRWSRYERSRLGFGGDVGIVKFLVYGLGRNAVYLRLYLVSVNFLRLKAGVVRIQEINFQFAKRSTCLRNGYITGRGNRGCGGTWAKARRGTNGAVLNGAGSQWNGASSFYLGSLKAAGSCRGRVEAPGLRCPRSLA